MTPEEHLGWRLSALIDGELAPSEELEAHEHLDGCEACRDELAELTSARSIVRSLGEVEPPEDYLERALLGNRSRYSPGLGLVGLVTLAAAWILFLAVGLEVALPRTSPPVAEFAAQHEVTLDEGERVRAAASDRVDRFERVDPDAVGDLDPPYQTPGQLSSTFSRVGTFDADRGEVLQVLYSDGAVEVSVFQQEGLLDPASLPERSESIELGERRGWLVPVDDGPPALVVQKGPIIYTVVADAPTELLTEVARTLPEPQDFSLGQRARRNVEDLARRFGLGVVP